MLRYVPQSLVGHLLTGYIATGLHTEQHPSTLAVQHGRQGPRRLEFLACCGLELDGLGFTLLRQASNLVESRHRFSIAGAEPLRGG